MSCLARSLLIDFKPFVNGPDRKWFVPGLPLSLFGVSFEGLVTSYDGASRVISA